MLWLLFGFFFLFNLTCTPTEPKLWKAHQTWKASCEMTWNCCWHHTLKANLFIVRSSCRLLSLCYYELMQCWVCLWMVAFHVQKENPKNLSFQTCSFDFPMGGIFLHLILKAKKNRVTGPDFSSDTWNQLWGMLKGLQECFRESWLFSCHKLAMLCNSHH